MNSPRPIKVLVIDDEPEIRSALAEVLGHAGVQVRCAADGYEALEAAREEDFEVALVDLSMPGLPGMETIQELRAISPDTEIIIITGHATVESSVQAIREKVFDYLRKPLDIEAVARAVQHGAERRRLKIENQRLVKELERERNGLRDKVARLEGKGRAEGRSSPLVGESRAMAQIRQFVADVANTDITVLIRGESGTGKDIVARLIHDAGDRTQGDSFVKINCPAIPESLLESELFGHEPGAFTGADRRKPGRFELAGGGTIFLDEIAEVPASLQAKLLQAIEHRQFTRLGGTATIHTKARIVAATNAPLERRIADHTFRADLFYRLNQYAITLPPLRDRAEDIPHLIDHFLRIYARKYERTCAPPSLATRNRLLRYRWPGNVRELESVIQRFVLTGREDSIEPAVEQYATPSKPPVSELRLSEIRTLLGALTEARWNQRKAAEILGISYSSLRRRVSKYSLKNQWLEEHSGVAALPKGESAPSG